MNFNVNNILSSNRHSNHCYKTIKTDIILNLVFLRATPTGFSSVSFISCFLYSLIVPKKVSLCVHLLSIWSYMLCDRLYFPRLFSEISLKRNCFVADYQLIMKAEHRKAFRYKFRYYAGLGSNLHTLPIKAIWNIVIHGLPISYLY